MAGKRQRGGRSAGRGRLTLLGRQIGHFPASPAEARLETFVNKYPRRDYWIHFETSEFTSLCPITGQPDFGSIALDYCPDRVCLESKSFKLYLASFRNFGTFYEEAVNRILDDLVAACRPRQARVTGKFNSRGGIAISVTAEYPPPR